MDQEVATLTPAGLGANDESYTIKLIDGRIYQPWKADIDGEVDQGAVEVYEQVRWRLGQQTTKPTCVGWMRNDGPLWTKRIRLGRPTRH